MGPIGVLCLQGDFREHLAVLTKIGVPAVRIRKPQDLIGIAGLIIPGGESTVIDKLSQIYELSIPIKKLIGAGLPVFGTCAGLIMLAIDFTGGPADQENFGGLDVTVSRNAFGTQVDSFETELRFDGIDHAIHVAFIRAPIVKRAGAGVSVLATLDDGQIVAVRQGNLLGISFHPEVTGVTSVHEYFVEMCKTANFTAEK
ncbi:MAG: pyridoxal 5'-phosphate synthase glutaminase subunit PdxT [Rhodoluna sp.]|nr:pyridoxal 5'-phosphate synthase glutaminase subunit PdxT [Rhodoluna sp.]